MATWRSRRTGHWLDAADRDQVAMLVLYVIVIVHHTGDVRRLRASAKPLPRVIVAASMVAIGPVLLTALLAAASNRPAVAYDMAGTGSLHPALLQARSARDAIGWRYRFSFAGRQ
jgi:hypothetical protein